MGHRAVDRPGRRPRGQLRGPEGAGHAEKLVADELHRRRVEESRLPAGPLGEPYADDILQSAREAVSLPSEAGRSRRASVLPACAFVVGAGPSRYMGTVLKS